MAEKLRVEGHDFKSLESAIDWMEGQLTQRVGKLNGVIDEIEGHWKGIAAGAYNNLQTEVNNDVRRVNQLLSFTKELVKASRDGFDAEELEQLRKIKSVGGGESGILGSFHAS
ncbi:WXG100 family type VII secretion target [Streptomyces sp. NPDC019937]|uniref:WXG100 family type VII secretion target n=1 Tax=Streptomyces sp. NPDC019937 TaxID=3154787 RepID=UPI0033F0BBBE